jgi:hypothetical protein
LKTPCACITRGNNKAPISISTFFMTISVD